MVAYATEAGVRRGASAGRLRSLAGTMRSYGCLVRFELHRRSIVFEIPEDGYAWIVTGGLAEVLAGFEDCVEWRARFEESPRAARAPALPAESGGA